MKKILIIGAGKSSSYLIKFLIEKSAKEQIQLIIADKSLKLANKLCNNHANTKTVKFNLSDEQDRLNLINSSDIVVSMLPARLHILIAKDCIVCKKNLVTASYVSEEMQNLDDEVRKNGLIFLNEVGVDPGLDHMSAMHVIDRIRDNNAKILLFESFTGGLIAPESDSNLWNYKFTWNPRNVVLAGQGGAAKFIQEGTYKYIPYHKLFRRTEFLSIGNAGKFEAYANRDSLKYRNVYGLQDIPTMYRGTIRKIGFSRAWNIFVQLGMTDDTYVIENSEDMSYRDFVNLFLAYSPSDSVELKLRSYLKIDQDDLIWEKLEELDLFNPNKKIGIAKATPAQILQRILEEAWSLEQHDKDMIVMQHLFGYEINGEKRQIESSLVVKGENQTFTAMAKTVGLPLGIATLLILNNKIKQKGVQIPISKEIYKPALKELKEYDIQFTERKVPYLGYNPNIVFG